MLPSFLLQSSKFALTGLFQSLSMELHTRRILVSLSFPPDTDTPLLASENETKPEITKRISEATATVPADVVGKGIVNGMVHYSPYIAVGFDGWMLATLTSGMGPSGGPIQLSLQILTMGLWRLVAFIFLSTFYSTVDKHDDKQVGWTTGGGAKAAAPASSKRASSTDGPASERKNK